MSARVEGGGGGYQTSFVSSSGSQHSKRLAPYGLLFTKLEKNANIQTFEISQFQPFSWKRNVNCIKPNASVKHV